MRCSIWNSSYRRGNNMGEYSQVNMVKWKHRLIRSLCICMISSHLFLKSAFEYEHRWWLINISKRKYHFSICKTMILILFFVLFGTLLVECRQQSDYLGFLWLRPSEGANVFKSPYYNCFLLPMSLQLLLSDSHLMASFCPMELGRAFLNIMRPVHLVCQWIS